mmetsp:Transcript_21725/g.38195  ORF Transcript_21725/g.38195 Transcript_21725/m.38195 type:complete len:188 (-) Transcript_21725:28-591(-)
MTMAPIETTSPPEAVVGMRKHFHHQLRSVYSRCNCMLRGVGTAATALSDRLPVFHGRSNEEGPVTWTPNGFQEQPGREYNPPENRLPTLLATSIPSESHLAAFSATVFQTVPADMNGSCSESTCPVCLDPLNPGDRVGSLACGHVFHSRCIRTWLVTKPICSTTCPMRCPVDASKDVTLRSNSETTV